MKTQPRPVTKRDIEITGMFVVGVVGIVAAIATGSWIALAIGSFSLWAMTQRGMEPETK